MIPESLAAVSRSRWGREAEYVAEIGGIYLVRVNPPFSENRRTEIENAYVIAFPVTSRNVWNGWCCNAEVMSGRNFQVERTIPNETLTHFRNLLSLI
jgi:hypothetical protein